MIETADPKYATALPRPQTYIFIITLLQGLNLSDRVGRNGSVFIPKCNPLNSHHSVVALEVPCLEYHAVNTLSDFVQPLEAAR